MENNPLGRIGTYLPATFTELPPVDQQREAARRLEAAGYSTLWVNETGSGKDAFVQTAILLQATESVVFATGVVPIWSRTPQLAHSASAQLAEAFPGRFVLGIGVGHPPQAEAAGREYGRPLATLRGYLEQMRAPQTMPPPPAAEYTRIIAAGGPKMLALGADAADGVFPAMQPPEFTATARETVGEDRLVVVAIRVDMGDAADAVAAQVAAHREAGADHVVLLPQGSGDFLGDTAYLASLAAVAR